MDIRNVTQFASFISNHNLATTNLIFRQIVICMGDYLRFCNCHRREDKANIYKNCNVLYIQAARLAATTYKKEIFAKIPDRTISFYSDNNQLIATASR